MRQFVFHLLFLPLFMAVDSSLAAPAPLPKPDPKLPCPPASGSWTGGPAQSSSNHQTTFSAGNCNQTTKTCHIAVVGNAAGKGSYQLAGTLNFAKCCAKNGDLNLSGTKTVGTTTTAIEFTGGWSVGVNKLTMNLKTSGPDVVYHFWRDVKISCNLEAISDNALSPIADGDAAGDYFGAYASTFPYGFFSQAPTHPWSEVAAPSSDEENSSCSCGADEAIAGETEELEDEFLTSSPTPTLYPSDQFNEADGSILGASNTPRPTPSPTPTAAVTHPIPEGSILDNSPSSGSH